MLVLERKNRRRRLWKLLLNTLMWSSLIEIDHRGFEETMELPLMEDQEMIQAFSSHTSQKTFVIWHWLVESGTAFEAP
jgi:hypothetical protein